MNNLKLVKMVISWSILSANLFGNDCSGDVIKYIKLVGNANTPIVYTINDFSQKSSVIKIALDADADQYNIDVVPNNSKLKLKIEQQYETSIAVDGEGPVLLLDDWRHYYSGWIKIDNPKPMHFVSRAISEGDSRKFPKVSILDVKKQISKHGEEWDRMVKGIEKITDPPIMVVISVITFKISIFCDNKWIVFHTVRCVMPVGC